MHCSVLYYKERRAAGPLTVQDLLIPSFAYIRPEMCDGKCKCDVFLLITSLYSPFQASLFSQIYKICKLFGGTISYYGKSEHMITADIGGNLKREKKLLA